MIHPMNTIKLFHAFAAVLAVASLSTPVPAQDAEVGGDILPVFQRAAAGAPLRVVLVGGSITQDGANLWVEDWLDKTFPDSAVVVHNQGMSATGSSLAVYRVGRDIIPAQPDLVFLEFAVNDGGMPDDRTILFLESIVVRLKSLPSPPAIVFLEAASRRGSKRYRHQKVAAHYGLLDIDLQTALEARIAETGLDWGAFLSDDVHPNHEKGHAAYAAAIAAALAPYAARAAASPDPLARAPAAKLPPPLSTEPLWLDATISALPAGQGWHHVPSLGRWWDRFFLGTIAPDSGIELYHIPFVGTDVGIMYPMDEKEFGTFYVSVDGGFPDEVSANSRHGYSCWGRWWLEPGEHVATVFVPAGGPPVQLGALLVAGSTRPAAPGRTPPPKSPFRVEKHVIPLDRIEWAGPYGLEYVCNSPSFTDALHLPFQPEQPGAEVEWKRLEGDGARVDLAALTGYSDRGVSYIRTTLESDGERQVNLGIGLDYFGKLWLNGELVCSFEGGYGPYVTLIRAVTLRDGPNELLLKVHSGSLGNGCQLCVLDIQRPAAAAQ